jgi:hypothetical protein
LFNVEQMNGCPMGLPVSGSQRRRHGCKRGIKMWCGSGGRTAVKLKVTFLKLGQRTSTQHESDLSANSRISLHFRCMLGPWPRPPPFCSNRILEPATLVAVWVFSAFTLGQRPNCLMNTTFL